jgi:hypothetical protein
MAACSPSAPHWPGSVAICCRAWRKASTGPTSCSLSWTSKAASPVKTNFYSVPARAGTRVEARVHPLYVEIWHAGRLIARHERCHSRRQHVLDLEHYLDVLSQKPGAFAGVQAASTMARGRSLARLLRRTLGPATGAAKRR